MNESGFHLRYLYPGVTFVTQYIKIHVCKTVNKLHKRQDIFHIKKPSF
jgi:hypothetical protein